LTEPERNHVIEMLEQDFAEDLEPGSNKAIYYNLKVLEELCEIYTRADITSFTQTKDSLWELMKLPERTSKVGRMTSRILGYDMHCHLQGRF